FDFFFSSRRRHTRSKRDWSSDVCSSDMTPFLGSIIYAAFGLMPILWGAVACFFLTSFLECFIHLEFQKQEDSADLITIIKEDFSASVHFLRREQPDILKLLLLAAMASL